MRIVALGGMLDATIVGGQSKDQHLPFHTLDDARGLRGANSADILLTAVWPAGVWKGSNVAIPLEPTNIPTTDSMAELCAALKPRYHFSMSPEEFFYEREPFFHLPVEEGAEPSSEVTRFISLASMGNASKAKALYAFTLQTEAAVSLPQGSTASPFARPGKKRPAADPGYSRFGHGSSHAGRDRKRRRNHRERSPPPGPDRCFFCLSNPNLSTHMVCSIGDECYVATAKGPLPSSTTFKEQGIEFPAHMVIVPLTHAPTVTTAAMGEAEASNTFKEMSRFREALQAMISSQAAQSLGAVTFEINRARGIHAHWQFMAVPAALIRKGLVEAAFRVEAENQKLPKLEVKDFETGDSVEGDYFRAWLWAEEEEKAEDGGRIIGKSLLMRFDEGVRFDLQFGRRVLGKLLGLDNRLIWQDIQQTEEEETADTRAFQKAFKQWDFTLADGS